MLATTAASPAELLLPLTPAGTHNPAANTSGISGWQPLLRNVAELDEPRGGSAARVLAATAAFVRQLQAWAVASQASPGAAPAGPNNGRARNRHSRQLAAGVRSGTERAARHATVSAPSAAAPAGEVVAAALVERRLLEYVGGVAAELAAMEAAEDNPQGEFQSFPMLRRSVVAALAAAALLHRTVAAGTAAFAAESWSDRVDAEVTRLLAQLFSLHRRGAVHKQGVELLHVSKSGGTSFNDLAGLNGCRAPAEVRKDNGLLPPPWDDRPRWLALAEAKARFRPVLRDGASSSIVDWWSDVGPRNPATYAGDARRGPYCAARLAALWGQYGGMQYSANEFTLYGGQDSPRDTFTCPQLLNTIIVREPHDRLLSHLLFMIPELVQVAAGSTAAFQPGGGAAAAADWDAAAPFLFDNFLARSLLGEALFRCPVGALPPAAQRFFGPAAAAVQTAAAAGEAAGGGTAGAGSAASAAAAPGAPVESPEDVSSAWGRMTAAAALLLQQFDVVMALEDGQANRPHFSRGLGWPQPLDAVRRRVGSDASIQVDAVPLLPPDLELLLQRHGLDSRLYRQAQLFSQLDRVVWDTARQLEEAAAAAAAAAEAAPGCSGTKEHARRRAVVRRRRRVLRKEGVLRLRVGAGSTRPDGMPGLVQQLLAAAAAGSRVVPDSARQAVAAAAAATMPTTASGPTPAPPGSGAGSGPAAVRQLLRRWDVAWALEQLLAGRRSAPGAVPASAACGRMQPGGQAAMAAAVAPAAWGSLANTTCGWVGAKLWASAQ
ncbi:hypothetical protein HXX76_015775 [Chlamydomonas incerta]|uniref:Uncharacterized protein n=1 Tax=Chlamydomonas incerta TaxID=51695 RepID=A0A835VPC1_CHLIN|nr:hypothetical protein HXX76_015775 [Chlamydomonas incerta]|eukprot:KAG2422755.1 hypothetical protein HXX76_015775 [Chlamydomonas incerta]